VTHPRKPLHPLGAAGLVALAAGLLAWLWLGEWRWAVTGFVVLVVAAGVGAAVDGRKGGAS
jgi:uncharacterized membrane protein YjjP (DUF1212 family)